MSEHRKDFQVRTLAKIPGTSPISLFWPSNYETTTADSTPRGLERQFTEQVAREALASCHKGCVQKAGIVFRERAWRNWT